MDDDNIEDISSHPFFVRAEFPFVFIPTTSTTGFTFSNSDTHVIDDDDDQTKTEFVNEKEKNEEERGMQMKIIYDQVDHTEENDGGAQDKSELRISQPKYSKLLKDLDFTHTRMVDVTNLLSDEAGNDLTSDENENENPKKLSSDDKYQSLSSARSSVSSNDAAGHQTSSNLEKDSENFTNSANDVLSDLNNLADIIEQASQMPNEKHIVIDTQKKRSLEEDDDTSKQATQNYDLNDNEEEDIPTASKSNKNFRFTTQTSNSTQDDNLSSIPRLNPNRTENLDQTQEYPITWENLVNGSDAFIQSPTILVFSQPINEIHTTPIKEQQSLSSSKEKSKQHIDPSSKQKVHYRSRQLSTSSEADSVTEYGLHRSKQKQHSTSQPQLSIDEDLNDLNIHLKQVLIDQDQPYTTASDILLRRLSNQQIDRTSPNRKKPHHHHQPRSAAANDTWSSMLEKLEREHKERLENQQKQYEEYMRKLEENMKRRFDEYLSTTNSLHDSKSETLNESIHSHHTHNSATIDSNTYQYRPLAKDFYSTNLDKRQTMETNISRSQSRENISNLRTELSAKHAKHVSDLKLYYDHEIDELKKQLSRSKMGQTSSTTRQSMDTIERINNENIRLHDEMKEIRHSLKIIEEENHSLKRQIEELRGQLNNKDLELKNSHRSINDLEKQLNEAHTIKERQDEKFRYVDRQALHYQEENEKITHDLNQTRERLLRLEEHCRELEIENKKYRQPGLLTSETNNQRITEDLKFNSTMPLNIPTSREYGRFTLTTSKYSRSTITSPRDENLESERYTTNGSDDFFRYGNSSRPATVTRISDYINEKPIFPQVYVPPSRPLYSPRKSPPNQQRSDQIPARDFITNQIKQSEQLEEKFDELLRKKRDLESRINRIPTRGLTNTDRQLLDVLEREIDRVEQQISSVKLELRKMNILRTH